MKLFFPYIASLVGLFSLPSTTPVEPVNAVEKVINYYPEVNVLGYTAIQVKRGFILSEAFVDGKKGVFIIDTGAPNLVLNQSKVDTAPQTIHGAGISSTLAIGEIQVNQFDWSGIHLKNTKALVVDLSHLESALQQPIFGLIGYEVLKEHELLIDYDHSIAQVFKTDRIAFAERPTTVIPFQLSDHLPIIEAKINGHTVHLGLDTGAESNLIDQAFAKRHLGTDAEQGRKIEIRGIDQKIEQTHAIKIATTVAADVLFANMEYLLFPLQKKCIDTDIKMDGLLGSPFFRKGKFSIDYRKQKIYFFHDADSSTHPDVQNIVQLLQKVQLDLARPR